MAAITPDFPNTVYFSCHKEEVFDSVKASRHNLIKPLIDIVVNYLINEDESSFGTREWSSHFNVQVDDYQLPLSIYHYWFQRDPIDTSRLVCDTHIPPVLSPSFLKQSRDSKKKSYSLKILADLVSQGRSEQVMHPEIEGIVTFCDIEPPSTPYWVVMRKDVVGRGAPLERTLLNNKQHVSLDSYSYVDDVPWARDLLTVLLTQRFMMGMRYLGDATGWEGRATYSYSRLDFDNKSRYHLVGGYKDKKEEGFLLPVIPEPRHAIASPEKGLALVRRIPATNVTNSGCVIA